MQWVLLACLACACSVPPFQGKLDGQGSDDPIKDAGSGSGSGVAFDEDEDGVSDDTDNCPNVMNQDQANGDTDLVGDACDPHHGGVADTGVFYGFNGGSDEMLEGYQGTITGGVDMLVSPTSTTMYTWLAKGSFANYQLTVVFEIKQLGSNGTTIDVRGGHSPGGTNGNGPNCQIKTTANYVQLGAVNDGTLGPGPVMDPLPLAEGDVFIVSEKYEVTDPSARLTCSFVRNNGQAQSAGVTASVPTAGNAGVSLANATIAVRSMFIAGRP
ncbi:MAG: hypothetical protein QM831_41290 [Kofleriaceae bacterium]